MNVKLVFVTVFILFAVSVHAQQHYTALQPMPTTSDYVVSQVTGIPFKETGLSADISGSPYLFDDWMPGKIILDNGASFGNVMLKFDALHNKFYFDRNDSTFELLDNVTEVLLKNTKEDNDELDFKKVTDKSQLIFVQELARGKVTLYKQYQKTIEGENFSNGLVASERKIVAHNSLWAIINNESIPVKLNSHSLEELTADKKEEVLNFAKSKKINIKNEKGFAAAIDYYNSISK